MAAIYDVGLDPITGDLPVFTRHITGADLVRQRIRARLGTFRGEWILDESDGLPFLEWRASKPLDLEGIRAVVQAEIEDCPGVLRVDDLTVSFNAETQTVALVGRVLVDDDNATEIPVVVQLLTRQNHMPALVHFRPSGAVI